MDKSRDLQNQRRDYATGALRRSDLRADPVAQFRVWLAAAVERGLTDATAMALATADANGRPAVRIVLLKGADASGLVFYSDYESHKGQDLAVNGQAEVLFYWREFERQVRVSGRVERVTAEESAAYFASRPRDSQLSAAASSQSAVIEDRAALEARAAELAARYPAAVPRPERWGGYRLVPDSFEFWQGREGRLHDRFRYRPDGGAWTIERLQP